MSCSACGRTDAIRLTDRGPVKSPIRLTPEGHFRFCEECRAASVEASQREGDFLVHRRTFVKSRVTDGQDLLGHSWILFVEDAA